MEAGAGRQATTANVAASTNDLVSDVSMRSLTRQQKQALLDRGRVEIYELVNDESRAFKPWPMLKVLQLTTLMRKWFVELLDHLPEATDAQLRTILFEEHTQALLHKFIRHYIQHTMCATSRDMVDALFQDYVALVQEAQRATVEAKGDEVKFKMIMGDYMKRTNVFFNTRTFTQIHGMEAVDCADVPAHLRALLASRRQRGERPGAGLMQIDKMTAMKAQHEKMCQSQRAVKTASIAQGGGTTTVDWEQGKRM